MILLSYKIPIFYNKHRKSNATYLKSIEYKYFNSKPFTSLLSKIIYFLIKSSCVDFLAFYCF